MANFSDLSALFFGLQSDSYRDRSLIFILVSAAGFALTLWITLYFAPSIDTQFTTQGVEKITLQGTENKVLYVRIYGPGGKPEAETGEDRGTKAGEGAESDAGGEPETGDATAGTAPELPAPQNRPLLILLPPAAGSLYVTDTVCAALRDRGFTVLTYSSPGLDSPAVDGNGETVRLSIPRLYRLINALGRGLTDVAANAGGRKLEEGRRQDLQFLLRELDRNMILRGKLSSGSGTIFLAGYGAGGAALTTLAGQRAFIETYPRVRGVIALEGPLLSSLAGKPLPAPKTAPGNPVSAFFRQIDDFTRSLVPKKITRIENIPQPALPILFILSGRVIQNRSGRYETILRTLGASTDMALLAAVPWAGPFDYSGSPLYYPLYSALFRGAGNVPEEPPPGPELTASLITNFAALILGTGESPHAGSGTEETFGGLKTTVLDKRIYLETGGVWRIPGNRTILQP
ncbi:MAG: hypothetical protein LBO65_02010 [Spirochaetaceae bacterium]|nr:hypothetical protein [Spirochaetaceae bacterium]